MRRLLLVLPLLLAIGLVACGGGGKGSGTATPPTSSDQSSQTPAAAPTQSGTPVPDPFASLQSYRYDMNLSADGATSIEIKGTVENPGNIRMDFYLSDSTTPISSLIIVGQQAWTQNEGDESWTTLSVDEAEGEVAGLMPRDFWGSFPIDQLVAMSKDQGEEEVNGVQAHHYQISQVDADMMSKLAEIFGSTGEEDQPTSFNMDLWRVDNGGWPAKASINVGYPPGGQVTNGQITWEVSDVNAVTESLQPPQ
ncbi:MAG: hypothetical protein ABSG55_00360 [Dehalococcoidia bacterium]|jgi:hypothetical protein